MDLKAIQQLLQEAQPILQKSKAEKKEREAKGEYFSVFEYLNFSRFEEQLHHTERIAEILEFAINTTCRNMGIGKEMLAQSYRIAADNGCSQIEVACNQLRKDTHRFYVREGMHNFHFKFSKRLANDDIQENSLGR